MDKPQPDHPVLQAGDNKPQAIPPSQQPLDRESYWRSLEELAGDAPFQQEIQREFPQQADRLNDEASRREFLKYMGASLALAGLHGCARRPAEYIVPYVRQPEDVVLGEPLYFATAMELHGSAIGLLVESHEGRPTKVEGNPLHPAVPAAHAARDAAVQVGATDQFAQASVLNLYDPDRSQAINQRGQISYWADFLKAMQSRLEAQRDQQGAGLRVLTETVASPTLGQQLTELLSLYPEARWHQYDPVHADNAHAGAQLAFGRPVDCVYHIERADVILALDADFLTTGPGHLRYARAFAERRRVSERPTQAFMSRLYAVESSPTLTGTRADHRLTMLGDDITGFVRMLAQRLGVADSLLAMGENTAVAESRTPSPDATKWLDALADDLRNYRKQNEPGGSLIIAGPSLSPEVHALVHAINEHLGNVGQTIDYIEPVETRPIMHGQSIIELVKSMRAGEVEVLVIIGGNPVFTAPGDLDFAEALQRVPFRVHLSLHEDETSAQCHWHLPALHFLESWSDTRTYTGDASIVQPLIEPLYSGISAHELLDVLIGQSGRTARDAVRAYWQEQFAASSRGSSDAEAQPADPAETNSPTTSESDAASETNTASQGQAEQGGEGAQCSQPSANKSEPTQQNGSSDSQAQPDSTQSDSALVGSTQSNEAQAGGSQESEDADQQATPSATDDQSTANGQSNSENATDTASAASESSDAFDDWWQIALHDGLIPNTAAPVLDVRVNAAEPVDQSAAAAATPAANNTNRQQAAGTPCAIIFRPDPTIDDGRFANNGWLQELPKPLSKLTWDNAALIAPQFANRLDLKNEDVVEISRGERSVRLPILILPGHPDGAVTLHFGYGRTSAGRVGNGAGVNVYPLRTTDAPWLARDATIRATGDSYRLAITQNHWLMEGRNLVRSGTLEQWTAAPDHPPFAAGAHDKPHESIYPDWKYEGYKWGMSIDLNSCTGCNACVVACQSENNIPVVGKNQVVMGREMHWLRIDRYYQGEVDNPLTVHQPVACVHCELAPCEPVCPVHATVHSNEGLNEMVYNRCVGTRYCSNNCPYKVRRFNFLQYHDVTTPVLKLLHNPDVTVRSRGVMEKCTYCVQRINAGRISAEKQDRTIRDGEVVTACQAACPSQAIAFGDLNDDSSLVRQRKEQMLEYALLGELNTRPRTTYTASLRNPNPRLQ